MSDWRDELLAITECRFCDDNGVRLEQLGKCDHQDYQSAAKRGMAMIREEMGWK